MAEAISYVTWRDPIRHGFHYRGKLITFKEGENSLPTRLWDKLKDGVARRFVKAKILVPSYAPVDEVAAAKVREVEIRRGIVQSPTAARHRAGAATDADVSNQRLRAEVAEMKLQMELLIKGGAAPVAAPELPFDPVAETVDYIKEFVGALDLQELVLVLNAEKASAKPRKTAVSAIATAIATAAAAE